MKTIPQILNENWNTKMRDGSLRLLHGWELENAEPVYHGGVYKIVDMQLDGVKLRDLFDKKEMDKYLVEKLTTADPIQVEAFIKKYKVYEGSDNV